MNTSGSRRPAVGEVISLNTYGRCTVESVEDPSIIVLRAESGARLKIGDRALNLLRLVAAGQDVRPTT